jgi:penicillin G amidase
MVTPTLARSRPVSRTRRMFFRFAAALLLAVALAAGGAAFWFYSTATASLPQLDGTVMVAGISAPVTVIRDAQAVPHITAATAEDLFFAQGYVTAQDRLWQMDIGRRWAAGEMSEVLGRRMLEHDREQRILGLRQVAERSAAALSERDRAHWEAYARGVNQYIEGHRGNLPIEFRVLRYQPRPWTVVDSFLCGANMAQALNHWLYLTELAHERVLARLGPELAADLYPNSSWRDHPPGQVQGEFDTQPSEEEQEVVPAPPPPRTKPHSTSGRGKPSPLSLKPSSVSAPNGSAETVLLRSVVAPDSEPAPAVAGSNNWVVSGAHTTSGKPLLSNDMHLVNTIPNTWYEAHLQIRKSSGMRNGDDSGTPSTLNVAGVTIPGMPFVIVGHNQRIAWGFTNLGPAVEDVYIENVNQKGEYQTPAGWRPMERRHEVIHVKGEADVPMDVLLTRHGPIITRIVGGETRPIALRWSLYDGPMTAPFFDIDAAQNWYQFRQAFGKFSGPAQNAVYADADGHIGYQATGRMPIRAAGDGSLPVSGADDAHEWTGYVPFDQLPSVFDPPSGIMATANGRTTADGYPHVLSNQWGPPYRTERIYRLLAANPKLTAADMLKVQTDVYSEFDHFCADRFVYAVDHARNPSARAREAANVMRGWDGRVDVDLAAPTIVSAARRELWRLLLEPRLGATPALASTSLTPQMMSGWQQYSWFMSSVAMENLLMRRPARWLTSGHSSFDELLAAAVESAVSQNNAPKDASRELASWRWGEQHRIELRHPVFGTLPVIGSWKWAGTGSHPLSGDGTTVKQIARNLGPSQRMTTDFADLDNSYLNIVTGQSGQIFSPHFMDQWKAWYQGTSFPLAFSDAAVQQAKQHELTFAPGR